MVVIFRPCPSDVPFKANVALFGPLNKYFSSSAMSMAARAAKTVWITPRSHGAAARGGWVRLLAMLHHFFLVPDADRKILVYDSEAHTFLDLLVS